MGMFCYQCQETAKGTGCTIKGVCGKNEDVSNLQDLLIYTLKGISKIIIKSNVEIDKISKVNHEILNSLFMTITNANFSDEKFVCQIRKMIEIRNEIKVEYDYKNDEKITNFDLYSKKDMIEFSKKVGVLSILNEDIRSLKELTIYGLKGMAAYTEHAYNLGFIDNDIYKFTYKALDKVSSENATVDELISLVLETGEYGVKAMQLLDKANTTKYGSPEITNVNIGVRNNPSILISGHDLRDLELLLEQTKGTGVDVYTHSEMLPGHYYPFFKKYENFVGNYGNAWWEQIKEFESFNGPILFTTNCIVPPRKEEIRKRIFTTNSSGYPGCTHIDLDENGKKDFSQIIKMAKELPAPKQIEEGSIIGGFAHNQVTLLADKVVDAVKSGAIKRFFVMAGCDGRQKGRNYYTEFAKALPNETIILTAGCAKYRYNKLNLGDISGIPRVLDAGQCNDSYSLVVIATKLKEAFGLENINDLPISYNIAWYEQKAVIVLLALLYLGVKNIHLGPTLPGFLSPNVKNVLIENFNLNTIGDVKGDISSFMS